MGKPQDGRHLGGPEKDGRSPVGPEKEYGTVFWLRENLEHRLQTSFPEDFHGLGGSQGEMERDVLEVVFWEE